MYDPITSAKNPLVQRLKSLSARRGRNAEGLFLVEGGKMVREALGAGLAPADALVEQGREADFSDLLRAMEAAGARVHPVPRHVLEAASDTETPNGLCCAFAPPPALSLAAPPDRLIALDGLQDPGNCGTIWRTADAAGFQGVLFGGGSADPLSPKVVRGAMGSSFRLPAAQAPDLTQPLRVLRDAGYDVAIATLGGDDLYALPRRPRRLALVVGGEARGVSPAVDDLATARLKLPMRGGAESLNAAVAAGIIMYELMRGMD